MSASEVLVLMKRNQVSDIKFFSSDPGGRLVVIDLTFRYVQFMHPIKMGKVSIFVTGRIFSWYSDSLVLLGDYNTICDTRVVHVALCTDRKGKFLLLFS